MRMLHGFDRHWVDCLCAVRESNIALAYWPRSCLDRARSMPLCILGPVGCALDDRGFEPVFIDAYGCLNYTILHSPAFNQNSPWWGSCTVVLIQTDITMHDVGVGLYQGSCLHSITISMI